MLITVLHGPNLNLLGTREPAIYGKTTLDTINQELTRCAEALGVRLVCEQHNGEGALVEAVHRAATGSGILINPAAYTHTSVALRDALLAVGKPTWEVHLSDPKTREAFRRVNLIEDIVVGSTAGQGASSYPQALKELVSWLQSRAKKAHL
jgi:3-dehydroquinate dehydratase-2